MKNWLQFRKKTDKPKGTQTQSKVKRAILETLGVAFSDEGEMRGENR